MAVKRPGIRIGSGALKGRLLRVAGGVRPSSSRLREALFNIWSVRLPQARFLDLFAGSGAIGLEAASRGARLVVLLERDPNVVSALRRSCSRLAPTVTRVIAASLPADLATLEALEGSEFDLVFADPPYGFQPWPPLLTAAGTLLVANGELAAEHPREMTLPERAGVLLRRDSRLYGDSALSFYVRDQD